MKGKLRNLVSSLVVAGVLVSPSFGEEPSFNWKLSSPVLSNYVFWGIEFDRNPVWQPNLEIKKKGFTGIAFSNASLDEKNINELDVFGDYYWPLTENSYLLAGGGIYNLKSEGSWDKDQEFYTGVGILDPIELDLFYHRLFGLGDGFYVEANVSKEFGERLNLRPSIGIGYHDNEYTEVEGLSHLSLGTDVTYQVSPRLGVNSSLNYIKSLDDKLEASFSFGLSADLSN